MISIYCRGARCGGPATSRGFEVSKASGSSIPDLHMKTSSDAATMILHEGAVHAEGPVWRASRRRPLFSGVPHRRLKARHQDDVRAAASTRVLAADLKA